MSFETILWMLIDAVDTIDTVNTVNAVAAMESCVLIGEASIHSIKSIQK